MMEKLTRIRTAMEKKGLEALLLTDEVSQHYATDFPFTDGYVLITRKSAHIITDFRYTEDARLHANDAFTVSAPVSHMEAVNAVMEQEGLHTIGYEDTSLSCAALQLLKSRLDLEFVPMGDLLLSLREIKDEDELSVIAAAQRLTDEALSHLLSRMTPQMTEIEVALELEFYMRRHGAEGVAFDTISVSGAASSLPHGKGADRPLQKGFLTMDFGARLHGYCADMTRTVCIGRADADMKKLYHTVLQAQLAALDQIRAGVLCAQVDKVARDLIDNAGYRGAFGHGLGHGVGMFIHEAPSLSPKAGNRVLQTGHVVTVEPGIYLEGKYGCRIEDMVAVTAEGCRNFTASPKELLELFA